MKRITALLLASLLALSLFAGCEQEQKPYVPTGNGLSDGSGSTHPAKPPESKDLTLVYYPERSMNPYESGDFTNRALFSLLYQGLFSVDRNYQAQPVLCRDYTVSDDMRTYTVTLDKATFSDGTPVTAADVTASLEAAKESTFYGGRFGHIVSFAATETGEIRFQTDTPFEDLPVLLDIPIVKAAEVASPSPTGSGPYVFERGETGKRLRRQPAWWCSGATPAMAGVIPLIEGSSASQIRDQFEFSDLSLVCADPGSDTYVDFRCDYELWESETGMFLYLGCNKKSRVFGIDSIRKALTYAVNRDFLVESFYKGFAHSAALPASPLSPYYSDALAERYDYEPAKFAEAVKLAQLENPEIQLLVNKDDTRRLRVARYIGKMLTEAGLKVTMRERSTEDFQKDLKYRNYDLYLGQTKLSPNMDLSPFFAPKGSLNYGGMSNAALHAMCLEALANRGNYLTLHEMVMEDGMLCPVLFRSYAVYARRGVVPGLSPSRDSVFYYHVSK